jgi:hypothetical protein
MEAATAGILARAHRAEARSAQDIFGRLLRAGHGAEFDPGRGLRVSGDLPAPLAGWSVPLLVALPVLARLAGNTTVPGDVPALHPSAARLAAAAARLTGMAEDELRRLVLAYRHGGAGGAAASVGASPCGDGEMAAAVAQVRAQRALPLGDLVMTRGTITDHGAGLRVRLGPDGRWYSFTHARGEWWPAVGAAPSAGAAYQAARRARSLRRA